MDNLEKSNGCQETDKTDTIFEKTSTLVLRRKKQMTLKLFEFQEHIINDTILYSAGKYENLNSPFETRSRSRFSDYTFAIR